MFPIQKSDVLFGLAALALNCSTGCLSSSEGEDTAEHPAPLAQDTSAFAVGSDALDLVAADRTEVSELVFDVAVRTGSATIHANVFTNPHCSSRGVTVLAVPGGGGTSFQLGPLARAILAHSRQGFDVRRIVAIDFPGHGNSPFPINLPDGTQFGDLLLEDDASVVLQSIDKLRAMKLAPRVVLTHSQGGLLVQTVQQMLLKSGSSLAAHGVKQAIMLSPPPPHGLEWHQSPINGDDVEFTTDSILGTYLTVPTTPEGAVEFLRGCFSTRAGVLVPNAPTGEEILAERYMATEPLSLAAQVYELELPLPAGGTHTTLRPTIDRAVFAPRNGTHLTVLSFSEDAAVQAADAKEIYEYLSGDMGDRYYRPIVSPEAVHCMLISRPNELLRALRLHFAD
jgi:pimeloyl-ACP methyl ester carboxylesterase